MKFTIHSRAIRDSKHAVASVVKSSRARARAFVLRTSIFPAKLRIQISQITFKGETGDRNVFQSGLFHNVPRCRPLCRHRSSAIPSSITHLRVGGSRCNLRYSYTLFVASATTRVQDDFKWKFFLTRKVMTFAQFGSLIDEIKFRTLPANIHTQNIQARARICLKKDLKRLTLEIDNSFRQL